MGTLNIEPIHPEFGAKITGVDLRDTPSADVVDEIRDSIDDYSFLCFPTNRLTTIGILPSPAFSESRRPAT